MWMVVGLGNPGSRYVGTRHNVGFEVVERLALRLGARAWRESPLAATLSIGLDDDELLLVRPLTFMNESGRAVARLRPQQLPLDYLMVVADDVHLPVGTLRMRAAGSPGGHKGLRSVEEHLGSRAYPRLRVGVGSPGDPAHLVAHVLGRFAPQDRELLHQALDRAVDAILCWVREGIGPAMSRHNGPVDAAREAR